MKGYRDNLAAHFDDEYLRPENDRKYPDLTIALDAAYYDYDHLLPIMQDHGIAHRYPENIKRYCEDFAKQAAKAAEAAIASTAAVKEEVW
jgi:hypothetical protein